VWNPQKKELLGRTGTSWAKIGAFYLVFYSCLAGFFAIMLLGFFSTLDKTAPTMQKMYSPMKQNPGMGFRPMTKKDSTLIKFNATDSESYEKQINDILSYLRDGGYVDSDYATSNVTHDTSGKELFSVDEAMNSSGCAINHTDINKSFGYADGEPCVLLKINKVYDWEPAAFDNETLNTEFGEEAQKALGDRLTFTDIGVTCEGENDADIDNLGGIQFYPDSGYQFQYFPYKNEQLYRAPLVFAKFSGAQKGVVMQVWCKLWTQNIKHHKNDKAGSVHFELMIDV